jgi:hypothetical protein
MASMMATKKRTPYCGVCFKAGKEKSMYTSHWTRATPLSNSEVTCPTILNTICKYCKERGHSLKYCKILKEKKSNQQQIQRPILRRETHIETDYPDWIYRSNPYQDLSDNDGFVKITPVLDGSERSWVSIAKRERRLSLTQPELCEGFIEEQLNKPTMMGSIARISNWADCSDDESCEYDYNYEYNSDMSRPCSPTELPY